MSKEKNASGLQLNTRFSLDTLEQFEFYDLNSNGHSQAIYTPIGLSKKRRFTTLLYCMRTPQDQYLFVPGRGFVGLLRLNGSLKFNAIARWWKSIFDYLELEVKTLTPESEVKRLTSEVDNVEGIEGDLPVSKQLEFAQDSVFFCLGDQVSLDFADPARVGDLDKRSQEKFKKGMRLGWDYWLFNYRDAGLLTARRKWYRENSGELDLWINNNVALFIEDLGGVNLKLKE